MTTLASFGNCHVHEWGGSGRTYELTLGSLPAHTEIRYRCYIHMVDSWDNEYNEIRMTTGSSSSGTRTYLNWRKIWSKVGENDSKKFIFWGVCSFRELGMLRM